MAEISSNNSQNPNIQADTKIRFHIFRDERFVDLTLFQYGWEVCDSLHQFGPAARNHFLFHYVSAGKGRLEINHQGILKAYTIHAGQGFLICPDTICTYYADEKDPWTYNWFEFDGLRARESMTLAGLNETQPVYNASGKNDVLQLMNTMLGNANRAPIRLVGIAMILLDEIVETSRTRVDQSNKRIRDFYMKEALGHIERNYHRDLPIEEIAEACGLNRSYFGRLFKEAMGESPQQFLIHYRMTKASELLKGSKMPIAEIGASVGYENQLHFSRAFKNVYGISPREFRSKHFYAQ